MIFIITITYPLHVSVPTDHLQVEYWLLPKELFFYNGSVVLVLIISYIYILVFCFGDFFAAVSMYVVDNFSHLLFSSNPYLSLTGLVEFRHISIPLSCINLAERQTKFVSST
jgi:hypothetical protein